MSLPRYAKAIAVVLGLLGLLVYVVLVDVGINAGRIHYGVSVTNIDVGGLTVSEAEDVLDEIGTQLKEGPILFGAEGFDCRFTPREIGWGPQPYETALAAMDVGRPVASAGSLAERIDAWLTGVRVKWAGKPNPARVDALLDRCETQARALGARINRPQLRYRIKRAIVMWPRPPAFEIPFLNS